MRHGRADSTGEVYDRLTDAGHRQAELLADYVVSAGVRPDTVYHGTMRRQKETADHLLSRVSAARVETRALNEFTPEFWGAMAQMLAAREMEFAEDLERYAAVRRKGQKRSMMLFLKLTERIFEAWVSGETPPQMESYLEFEERVKAFARMIEESRGNGTIFVFSSGTPLSVMISHFLGWERSRQLDWMRYLYNTSLSVFLPGRNGGLSPAAINTLAHLPPELHTLL